MFVVIRRHTGYIAPVRKRSRNTARIARLHVRLSVFFFTYICSYICIRMKKKVKQFTTDPASGRVSAPGNAAAAAAACGHN